MRYSILILSLSIFSSCFKKTETESEITKKVEASFPAPSIIKIELANKLVFIGPEIDSSKVEIYAPCDCCFSDLAFLVDSTFVMVDYCIGGHSYSKGKYSKKENWITLQFDSLHVGPKPGSESEIFLSDTTNYQDSFEVTKSSPSDYRFYISSFKSKPLFIFPYEESNEYGFLNTEKTTKDLIQELKRDGVWELMEIE